jgi:hypothetical protein
MTKPAGRILKPSAGRMARYARIAERLTRRIRREWSLKALMPVVPVAVAVEWLQPQESYPNWAFSKHFEVLAGRRASSSAIRSSAGAHFWRPLVIGPEWLDSAEQTFASHAATNSSCSGRPAAPKGRLEKIGVVVGFVKKTDGETSAARVVGGD